MRFTEVLKSILVDVDNQGSSKRLLLLWIGGPIWAFVHIMVFMLIKPFTVELAATLLLYDVVLIGSLAGLAVSEKIWGRDKTGKPDSEPPK